MYCGLAWLLVLVVARTGGWNPGHWLNSKLFAGAVALLALLHGWQTFDMSGALHGLFTEETWAWIVLSENLVLVGLSLLLWWFSPKRRAAQRLSANQRDTVYLVIILFNVLAVSSMAILQTDEHERKAGLSAALLARSQVALAALDANLLKDLKNSDADLDSPAYQQLKKN